MDINIFSPKSQTLSLTTCTPPPLTWINPSSLQSIRRQFLRPQSPTRRNCKKLGLLHPRSPQFLVKASISPPPNSILIAVVVALATFTAVSFAYLNHFLKNRNKSSRQVTGSENHASRQLSNDTVDGNIENQIVDPGDLSLRSSSGGNENLMEIKSNQVSEERTAQESALVLDSPQLTETSISISADSFVSPQQECPPFMLSDSGIVQPLIFATEMSELQLGKEQKETKSVIEPRAIVNVKSCDSSILENDAHAEVSELTINGVLTEVVREEQYAYLGANQSVLKSPANLDVVKAISCHASPLNSFSLFSLKRDSEHKGADLSMQEALPTAEHVEGKILLACHKQGPFHKSKVTGRGRSLSRNKERTHLVQDDSKNILQFPYPNGKQANDANDVSEQFRSYNRLIRNGRLTDCLDLLEDMERKGLLDMNQVYHARFFNVCKSQKAIKEAFRFFKLVPNPTLSTFNMLMSVCASSKDSEGAFQVLQLVREAGLIADCKLYTTLITTCAKSGKVDAMFEVFHEMVNAGVEPNVQTYGALIDGCAKAGQVAKAFGAYGIMRSKNVKPDRVVFNALITACGQSGAVDRAFDVLAEMNAEVHPIEPDHITIGALIKACANAGQVDRAREVYKMIHMYNIKGTPEVYTIAINCCSQTGDWEFACSVYDNMTKKGVVPDEVFLSALIDFAGHAGKVDAAFEILQEAKNQGIRVGIIAYSSLMGACSNAKNWQMALELYEHMKSIKLKPTVSTMNALITALCDGGQLPKAMEVLSDMKKLGLRLNTITYSILLVASERKDDVEVGLMLFSQAKEDGVTPSFIMFKCIIGMCLRRYKKARTLGEHVLSFNSGRPQIENKWYYSLSPANILLDTLFL